MILKTLFFPPEKERKTWNIPSLSLFFCRSSEETVRGLLITFGAVPGLVLGLVLHLIFRLRLAVFVSGAAAGIAVLCVVHINHLRV